MRKIKEFRELARELVSIGIISPYFFVVTGSEVKDLHNLLTGFVDASLYGPSVAYNQHGYSDVGACEHFRFVVKDRRSGPKERMMPLLQAGATTLGIIK